MLSLAADDLLHSGADSGGGQTVVEVMVPGNKVGLVIGRGGETIRQLQVAIGCRLTLGKCLSVVNNEKRDGYH